MRVTKCAPRPLSRTQELKEAMAVPASSCRLRVSALPHAAVALHVVDSEATACRTSMAARPRRITVARASLKGAVQNRRSERPSSSRGGGRSTAYGVGGELTAAATLLCVRAVAVGLPR